MGAISWERDCRMRGEIPSGPGALEGSKFSSNFLIPFSSTMISCMGGAFCSGRWHFELMSASVYCFPSLKAELNCLFKTWAFSFALVTSCPLSLKRGDSNIRGFLFFDVRPESFVLFVGVWIVFLFGKEAVYMVPMRSSYFLLDFTV